MRVQAKVGRRECEGEPERPRQVWTEMRRQRSDNFPPTPGSQISPRRKDGGWLPSSMTPCWPPLRLPLFCRFGVPRSKPPRARKMGQQSIALSPDLGLWVAFRQRSATDFSWGGGTDRSSFSRKGTHNKPNGPLHQSPPWGTNVFLSGLLTEYG